MLYFKCAWLTLSFNVSFSTSPNLQIWISLSNFDSVCINIFSLFLLGHMKYNQYFVIEIFKCHSRFLDMAFSVLIYLLSLWCVAVNQIYDWIWYFIHLSSSSPMLLLTVIIIIKFYFSFWGLQLSTNRWYWWWNFWNYDISSGQSELFLKQPFSTWYSSFFRWAVPCLPSSK